MTAAKPLLVKPHLKYKRDLVMEVDTGATMFIISSRTFHKLTPRKDALPLKSTLSKLQTYTGESLVILGEVKATIEYITLPLVVVVD